jgi:hypothetical protein
MMREQRKNYSNVNPTLTTGCSFCRFSAVSY